MRPFGKFYSAHHSAHVKWRVATHSDHSCCERVSERPRCCNLICLSCEVKAFIISARAIRCHLHWTWHVHVLLQPWDSCTGESRGRWGWKMKASRKTATGRRWIDGWRKSQGQLGCGGQGDRSCWRQSETMERNDWGARMFHSGAMWGQLPNDHPHVSSAQTPPTSSSFCTARSSKRSQSNVSPDQHPFVPKNKLMGITHMTCMWWLKKLWQMWRRDEYLLYIGKKWPMQRNSNIPSISVFLTNMEKLSLAWFWLKGKTLCDKRTSDIVLNHYAIFITIFCDHDFSGNFII